MFKLSTNLANRIKFVILVGMVIYFVVLYRGRWTLYIEPRFRWLSLVAVLLFAVLALAYARDDEDHDHAHDHHDHHHHHAAWWPLFMVAIPLLLALLPPTTLSSSAVKTRGVQTDITSITLPEDTRSVTIVASKRNLLDWARVISSSNDPLEFIGEQADVVGFVYRDSRFTDDQFWLARFTIACCVADALPVGIVVQLPESGDQYATDSWVRVRGHFEEQLVDDNLTLVLVPDQIESVEQPAQPYLYQ